ncbi:MAG: LPS export ABC transporter ATP-binding protein [Deltaproteobacteria bacterium]|nr:LPS export ABC transporter ATP-binding protein [Deltaproteobacteria bacterium]
MSDVVLQAVGVTKSYRRRKVVDGVSFEVHAGEVFGLLGPNGAGKTTTFNMIVGRVRPESGEVYLGKEAITRLPMYRRARKGLGYLPQEASIFRRLTVRENFLAILEASRVPRPEREARVESLLEDFDLSRIADSLGGTLSGGERRRVEVARCLIPNPSVVLFDEPFAGVDPIAVGELQTLIRSLEARGIAVIITDHNVRETLGICDRAAVLANGKLLAVGSPEEIAGNPSARAVYLGDAFSLDGARDRLAS